MAATFRTRPWLLAPARSTLLSSFLVGAPRPLAPTAGQTRSYAKKLDFQIRSHKGQAMKINRSQASTSSMMNDMVSQMANNDPAEMAVLTPGKLFFSLSVAMCRAHARLQGLTIRGTMYCRSACPVLIPLPSQEQSSRCPWPIYSVYSTRIPSCVVTTCG